MTDVERMVLILTADLALMSDGYTPLADMESMRNRLRLARHTLDAEAYQPGAKVLEHGRERNGAGTA